MATADEAFSTARALQVAAPSREIRTLPASWYHDPAVYECERQRVFAAEWQLFAHTSELAEPGDYVAGDLAGWQLFAAVGADRTLRAFHNVCPHRAGPIVWPDSRGRHPNLVCRYHGWAFESDGRLKSARDFDDPHAPTDRAQDEPRSGLVPVRVAQWRGLVFVNLSYDARPLAEWLGSFASRAAPFEMETLVHAKRVVHHVACNWKTYADNYLEGYHIPLVHPGLNRAVDASRYVVRLGEGGRWASHEAPPRNSETTAGLWLWHWPNVALNIYPGGMSTERFVPRGPGNVDLVLDYYFPEDASDDERRARTLEASFEVTAEDRQICEIVQRNLEAGIYRDGVLSPKHELGVAAFQQLVLDAIGQEVDRA